MQVDKKTALICLLDKEYPPSHSFIDGMLVNELSKVKGLKVYLVVSKGISSENIEDYNETTTLPLFYERSGVKRFMNFFIGVKSLKRLIIELREEGYRIILFVRNEPVYLILAKYLRGKVDKLIYQQSFPHELSSSSIIKRTVAKSMLIYNNKKVDSLVAVSPLGLKRLRQYFHKETEGLVIPLLSSRYERVTMCNYLYLKDTLNINLGNNKIHFVYIGTHAEGRRLDLVIKSIIKAYQKISNFEVCFIGGTDSEIKILRNIVGVEELECKGVIHFCEKISRKEVLNVLPCFDIGLSLIPPSKIYKESSPTKVTEYMNMGLAVLASKEIPMQEEYIRKSKSGVLADWSEEGIMNSIIDICETKDITNMKKNALRYSEDNLNYSLYTKDFLDLISK